MYSLTQITVDDTAYHKTKLYPSELKDVNNFNVPFSRS